MTALPKKSKRGRPPKPSEPISLAERMRAYRKRRKAAGVVARRFSREERRQRDTFKANAATRKRLKLLVAQAQALENAAVRRTRVQRRSNR